MDREKEQRNPQTFAWLPQQMPKVAERVKEYRAREGDAWVNECWTRGVVLLQPGWFYAREGALAVGVAWDGLELLRADTSLHGQVLVVLRRR